MLKDVKQTYWKLSAGCIGSALPLMLFGPGVMGFFIVFGILLGFIATKGNSLRSSIEFVRTSRVSWLVLGLLSVLFVSSLLSIDIDKSMYKLSELMGISVLALALYIVLREMPLRHVDLTYQSLGVSTIVVALLALTDALWGDMRLSAALHGVKQANDVDRLMLMSSVFAVLSPFLWAWLLRLYNEGVVLAKWLALPASLLSVLAVFVSGGYMGWFALVLSLVLFTVIAVRYHRLEITLKGVGLTAFSLCMGPVVYLYSQGVLFSASAGNGLEYLLSKVSGFFSMRLDVWAEALGYLKNHILFGYGLNTYKALPWEDASVFPEGYNFFIQLLLETGVVGAAFCCFVLYLILRYFLHASLKNLYALAGFVSIVAFLVSALGNTSIFHPWWLTMLIFSGIFSARVGWIVTNKRI